MLKKSKRVAMFCMSIVILFTLYITVILDHFFTKDSITKESIVGVNPISATKSTMSYQEPLTVILEEQEKQTLEQQEEIRENSQNVELTVENQEIEKEIETRAVSEEQIVDNIEETILRTTIDESEKETVIEGMEQGQSEEENSILTEYKGFSTVGKIEIPKTGVDTPILNQVTVEGMKNAPCLLYSTGELNQNGNNLIVGHNFRNGTIFSDNKNLQLGDKIYVTTLEGNQVEYTIYDKFITTAEDVSYIKRDTNNKPEITLSCCTDDDEYRIIILAKL